MAELRHIRADHESTSLPGAQIDRAHVTLISGPKSDHQQATGNRLLTDDVALRPAFLFSSGTNVGIGLPIHFVHACNNKRLATAAAPVAKVLFLSLLLSLSLSLILSLCLLARLLLSFLRHMDIPQPQRRRRRRQHQQQQRPRQKMTTFLGLNLDARSFGIRILTLIHFLVAFT